jgi:hypothetical protein
MKFDASVLHAAIIVIVGIIALTAAGFQNWNIVGVALAGLFAALNLRQPPQQNPDPQTRPEKPL